MARHRNIEEEFRAIAPRGRRGIPPAPPIAVGVTGSGGADSTASMSQASQEISQLEAQFKQQASLIQANTQALQESTATRTGTPVGSSFGGLGGGLLSDLGLLSPIVSGIMSLFGIGSKPAPAPLPFYTPPPSVQMSDTFRTVSPSAVAATSAAPSISGGGAASAAPQVTVNVSAMDSQSFMDRSSDIANAVRSAMLNLHPINDVIASL